MNRTEQAIELARQGKWKEALRIFKTFRIELTKGQQRVVGLAYECMTGKADFYASIGIEPDWIIGEAKDFITRYYINKK